RVGQPGDSQGDLQAGVPGRLGRPAVAHASGPGGSLHRAERDRHEQRPADPPVIVATIEDRPDLASRTAGSGGRGSVWRERTPLVVVVASATGLLVVSLLIL